MNLELDAVDGRFALMETKLAYQELAIKELGTLVYEQARAIDRMESMLKLVGDKVKSMDAGTGLPMPSSERPPHD